MAETKVRYLRVCKLLGHDWRYYEDPDREYTGYLERCERCGTIVQVPQ